MLRWTSDKWIPLLDSFDFMGDMAFGGGFELMRDGGDREGIWNLMESALEFVLPVFVPQRDTNFRLSPIGFLL